MLQAAQVVNAKPMLLLAEQKELEKSRAQDQGGDKIPQKIVLAPREGYGGNGRFANAAI